MQKVINEYPGVYRATSHTSTGKSPAQFLHGRKLKTRLNLTELYFELLQDPQKEIKLLGEGVQEQVNIKRYTDTKRTARAQDFEPDNFVRVRLPGYRSKGIFCSSEPRQIISRRGQGTFLFDDQKLWNYSKFPRVHSETVNSRRG